MVFQRLLARLILSAFLCSAALQRFVFREWSILIFSLVCFILLLLHIAVAVLYIVFVHPNISSLRHLPTAPQPPIRRRLFKEPCAYHFEKWINEVPNDGLIRYFGVLNLERVLLTSSPAIREVLQSNAYSFEKQYAQKTHLERVSGKGLVFQEGSAHQFQRKILDPAFRWGLIKTNFYPLIWRKTGEMLNMIEQENNTLLSPSIEHVESQDTSAVVSMDDVISRSVFDIIGLLSYGIDFDSIGRPETFFVPLKDYREAFQPSPSNRMRVYLAFILPTWLINALPIRFNRTTAIGISRFRSIGNEYVSRRQLERRTADTESKKAFPYIMETILAEDKLSKEELLEQFSMLQAGGIHTTAAAVMSAIWYLAQPQHHELQAQLRNEIRREVPSLGSSPITSTAFEKCKLLKAVINEVLRMHPPFSWFGRTPSQKTEVCGTLLPAGVSISLSPWAIQRSKSSWGSGAFEFKPERWLQDKVQGKIPEDSFAWLAFGAGPRRCIGERLARAELECLLAGLFGRFGIQFDEEQKLPSVTHQVTLAFREELRVRLTLLKGW